MVPFGNKDTFNAFAIAELKEILAGSIPGGFNLFSLKPPDGKMPGQQSPDIFGQIGHQIKAVSLMQIEPLQNLVGAIGGNIARGQPGNQLLRRIFDDIDMGVQQFFRPYLPLVGLSPPAK